jgi:hypothetical protein
MAIRSTLRCAASLLVTLILPAAANGQVFRAYLAIDGNDGNPCTLPAPCRLLPAALNAVADGGQIWMLDSANYNTATVTIGKSVSILAVPGAVGSVLAIGGPAVSITAPSLKVALRNLVIMPLAGGGGTDGINMTGASTVTVEDSLIANLPSTGVSVTGTGTATIVNSTLQNNAVYGAFAHNGASISLSGSKLLGNTVGVWAKSDTATTSTVIVSDSFMSGNGEAVIAASYLAGATAIAVVTRSTIEGANNVALECSTPSGVGTALITVSGSTITKSGYAWYLFGAGAVINTLRNNHIADNVTTQGVLTATLLQ